MMTETVNPDQLVTYQFNFGFRMHPLNREKKPIHTGWARREYSLNTLLEHVEGGGNIGIRAGEPEGLGVLDLDTHEARALGPRFLPSTLTIRKRDEVAPSLYLYLSPGLDYFRIQGVDGGEVIAAKFSASGKAHQFVSPPSIHPSKGPYQWTEGFDPSKIRNVILTKLEGAARLLGVTSIVAANMPPEGGRHEYALALAGFLLKNGQPHETVEEILYRAWQIKVGSVEGRTMRELSDIVESTMTKLRTGEAFKGGGVLKDFHEKLPRTLARALNLERPDMTQNETKKSRKDIQRKLVKRWRDDYPLTRRGQDEWRTYREGVWEMVEEAKIRFDILRMIDVDDEAELTASLVDSVYRLARDASFVPSDRWDTQDGIIICNNGVLRLDDMTFVDHDPGHFALSKLPFDYDPDALAPNWERVGTRLDRAVWEYLQEFVGVALTTDNSHEQAIWLVGEMGSGKSTFIEGVQMILGPRHGVLSLKDVERSPFALGEIPGKTLLTATEQPADYVSQGETLNAIISGETILVDRKYRDPIRVKSTAKILWAMNAAPRIPDQTSGLWRRIKRIDWPHLSPQEKDKNVKRDIYGEGPGILNWAVEGLRRVLDRGDLIVPEVIEDATEEFRRESDVERLFLEERGVFDKEQWTPSGLLYATYKTWAEERGYRPKSDQNVGKEWERLGLEKRRHSAGVRWFGFRLRGLDELRDL